MSGGSWIQRSREALPEPPLDMPQGIWQLLHGRGLKTREAIESWYSPQLKDLTPPQAIDQMDVAVERLLQAYKEQESVCIYADFDLDGTPGLALLYSGLQELGFENLSYYQPKRLSEGYGIHKHALDQFAKQGVQLIVTVDVGITDIESIQYANELGIDVIVTDHHLPKEELPPALAIVNPNKKECGSGLGHLCGAGVAFYLVLALKSEMQKQGLLETALNPKDLLDCFAIGTLTDMVPLIRENRTLVKHGLKQLENTKRPGLKALLVALDMWGRPINSQDVGYRFAPKLNALSRMEEDILPIDIFLETDEKRAEELVEKVLLQNKKRTRLQKKAEKEAEEFYRDRDQQGFVWAWSDSYHQGVVGLVATKLAQKFNVPAFVGCVKEDGSIVGSSRLAGDESLSLLEVLDHGKEVLEKFGGHAPAAGFELRSDHAERFEEALKSFFADSKKAVEDRPFEFDAEAEGHEINPSFMRWYESLGPFGQDFEVPIFRINKLKLKAVKDLRGGHKKLTLMPEMGGIQYEGMWFSPPESHPALESLTSGYHFDVLAQPEWNYYMGQRRLQLLLKDIRPS
jgi:single-stranded-DNA-specific exonuclease